MLNYNIGKGTSLQEHTLFLVSKQKTLTPCPIKGTNSKGSTRASVLGMGTDLNRICQFLCFFLIPPWDMVRRVNSVIFSVRA